MSLHITNKTNLPPTRRTCINCGSLGHLAKGCKRAERAYLKIGIEIEGYWNEENWGAVRERAQRAGVDGDTDGSLGHHTGYESYEWKTTPGTLGESISQLLNLYPDATDEKCGMHVHVSFGREDVIALTHGSFFEYFDSQWRAWGKANDVKGEFWKRLDGENRYCGKSTTDQFHRARNAAGMGRYKQLNFASWNDHKTVECRLLPMFRDARLGVLAVEHLIHIYESWLSAGLADSQVWDSASVAYVPPTELDIITRVETIAAQLSSEVPAYASESRESVVKEAEVYRPVGTPGHSVIARPAFKRYMTAIGVM